MEPIWRILQAKATNADWTPQHQGGLRSAIAGRQFPQARMKAAGWAKHDRCLVCLNEIVEKEAGSYMTAGSTGDSGTAAKKFYKRGSQSHD